MTLSYTESRVPRVARRRQAAGLSVFSRVVALAVVFAVAVACRDSTAPADKRPPYLAIVTRIDPASQGPIGGEYTYRVRELSGSLDVDKTVHASPKDTVILSVPPATYEVSMAGVPPTCRVRDSLQHIVIDSTTNTGLVRFFVTCKRTVTIVTLTDGYDVDPEFVYRLTAVNGSERVGILGATDTLAVDNVPPGDYTLTLAHVAANCVVTSDGGERQRLTVASGGGAEALFRVVCSDDSKRPRILAFSASYHDGTSAFVLRFADPTRDVEGYVWNLTDCNGASILPNGSRLRRGVTSGRTAGADTATIVAVFEVGLPDDSLRGRCTAIRVFDAAANTTSIIELPIAVPSLPAGRPVATTFNARLIGTQRITTLLQASDAEGDFVGTFATARLRDGILSPPDGIPDLGIYNTVGYLGTLIPDVPLGGGRPKWDDYYAVIVYLVDAAGNFARIEDANLLQ